MCPPQPSQPSPPLTKKDNTFDGHCTHRSNDHTPPLNFEVWGLHGNVSIRKAFTSECTTLESDFIVEVPVATPTMQAGKGSWMGLFTRRANCGVGFELFVTRLPDKFDDSLTSTRDLYRVRVTVRLNFV